MKRKLGVEHAENLNHHDILLFDPNSVERETLRTILKNVGYDVFCVADEVTLLEAAQRANHTCIILDVSLRGAAGLAVLEDLRDYGVPVIVTSENGDIPTAVEAIKAGARNFIQKPFGPETIIDELEKLRRGLAGSVCKALRAKPLLFDFSDQLLTRRERDVVGKIGSGLSTRESALALGISHRTVEDHRSNIMRKLGARNAAELMIAILKSDFKARRRRSRISSPVRAR